MDKYRLTAYILIAIWFCIYLPISLYGIHLFHQNRFVQVISKRHMSTTLIVIGFCLCHICVDRVLWVIYICDIYSSFIFSICVSITYPIMFHGLLFSLVLRFWIIRFDLHFLSYSVNNRWQSVINEECVEESWYVRHREKWANKQTVICRVILPLYTFCISLCIGMRAIIFFCYDPGHFGQGYDEFTLKEDCFDLCVELVPYLCIVYLWYNMPTFDDAFWIHGATKIIFIILGIKFGTNVLFAILIFFSSQSKSVILYSLIKCHIIATCNFLIILVLSFSGFIKSNSWPYCSSSPSSMKRRRSRHLKLLEKVTRYFGEKNNQAQIETHSKLAFELSSKDKSSPKTKQTKKNKLKKLTLCHVIKDLRCFSAFMAHLGKEYSMEGLLAIVEFTQYQSYVLEHFSDYLSCKHDYKGDIIELPADIPKSQIVYGSMDRNRSDATTADGRGSPMSPGSDSLRAFHKLPPLNDVRVPANTPYVNLTLSKVRPNYGNVVTLDISSPRSPNGVRAPQSPNNQKKEKQKKGKMKKKSKGLYADLRPFQTKASMLYQKYIAIGSEYEINISYGLRTSFARMLGDETVWSAVFNENGKNRNKLKNEKIISDNLHRILRLFKESVDEMIKLCGQSFSRFKRAHAASLGKYIK